MLTPAIRATRASPQKEQRCGLLRTFARAATISIASAAPTPEPLLRGHPRQIGERGVELGLVIRTVLKLASLEIDVGLHVEVTVTTQIEQDRARSAFGLAAQRLVDRSAHRMVGFRRRQDAFGARKLDSCFEATRLRVGARLDEPEFL